MGITVYSIGHSNKSQEDFIKKLLENQIDLIIDIRSFPYSKYTPHFNRFDLKTGLANHGIGYLWRGKNLGGKVEDKYDNENYDFHIKEVIDFAKKEKVAIMCSEADYKKCHRHFMVQPDIEANGAEVKHIMWGEVAGVIANLQGKLF